MEVRLAVHFLLAAILPWGCSVVGTGPTAEFEAATRFGAAPLQVEFTDLSSPGSSSIEEWTWWFGDGTKSSERNPVHIYEEAGTFNVSLLVSSNAGADSEFKTGYIVVSPKPAGPDAEFLGAPSSGGKPLTVQFTDQSNPGGGAITSWSWSFGDGGASTSRNPSHVYENEGVYDVSLVVQTSIGSDSETKSGYIVVSAGPTAAFTGAPRSGTTPLAVQFTDQSIPGTSAITGWAWSFGDGATSTAQSPSHTYATTGSFDVSLTVTTSAGSDNETKSAYIVATQPPNAAFEGSPRAGDRPLAVQFTDLSTAGSAPITAWSWAFGDGGTSTSQNPAHTYTTAGNYTVALTVTTSDGSDTATEPGYITVSEPPAPPAADFSASPTSGPAPLPVQFTDQSIPGTSPITGWAWSFGDGGVSTLQNPSHTYAAGGSYTVSLAVTTAAGNDTEERAGYITVSDPILPTAGFSGSPLSGSIPLAVQFTDQSIPGTSAITGWAWSFGDGATSAAQNPSHTYSTTGSFDVSLTVTTSAGSDNETKSAYVVATQPPNAAFEGAPRAGDRPLAVQFTDLSTEGSAPITNWSWAFGDGGTSASQNPAHTYTTAGNYTVALTVTTSDGSDTATEPGYVIVSEPPAPPAADFSASPTSGPAPLPVQFSDLSTPGTAPITSWLWDFGDAGTSTAQNPSHTYLLPGTYPVSLTVTTADGADSETKSAYITACAPPTADFLAAPTTGFAPLTAQFTDLSLAGVAPIGSWSWSFGDGGTSAEQNPSHAYTAPGVYDVSLSVSDACGSDIETKSSYVTVQDSCDTAAYSIADAWVEFRADADQDSCAERARVHFDANVRTGCSRSVFAKVLLRPEASTDWTFELQSACFTITGTSAADANWIQVQNLPLAFYEIRVELYECGGTLAVGSRDYLDDPDLDNRCFE